MYDVFVCEGDYLYCMVLVFMVDVVLGVMVMVDVILDGLSEIIILFGM